MAEERFYPALTALASGADQAEPRPHRNHIVIANHRADRRAVAKQRADGFRGFFLAGFTLHHPFAVKRQAIFDERGAVTAHPLGTRQGRAFTAEPGDALMAAMNKMLGQHLRGLHVIWPKGIGFVEIAGARRKHQRYAFLRRALTQFTAHAGRAGHDHPIHPLRQQHIQPGEQLLRFAPTVEQENHSPLRFKLLGQPGGQFCIKRRREIANDQPYHPALPTAQRRRLAITHKAQLLNGLVDALTRCRRDAPLPA